MYSEEGKGRPVPLYPRDTSTRGPGYLPPSLPWEALEVGTRVCVASAAHAQHRLHNGGPRAVSAAGDAQSADCRYYTSKFNDIDAALFFFIFLAAPHGMQDLSSPTRQWTRGVLTTGPPGNSRRCTLLKVNSTQETPVVTLAHFLEPAQLKLKIWGWAQPSGFPPAFLGPCCPQV